MNLKRLANGVTMAAAFALAGPAWAQGPVPKPPSPPAATAAMPPAHHAVRHAKAMHGFHRRMAHKAALRGDTTARLNREELARIQSGSPPAAAPMPPAVPR
jgi:hypothetical protein